MYAVLLALCAAMPTAGAAVIANYDFTGQTNGFKTSLPPAIWAENVSVTDITANTVSGAAIGIQSGSSFGLATPYMSAYPGLTAANDIDDATTNGWYFSLTLTADSGYFLDLESLDFRSTRGGGGNRGFAIQTSVLGFSTDGTTNIDATGAASPGAHVALTVTKASFNTYTYDLSAAAYQNLSSITFRFYVYSPNTSQTVEFDDMNFNGTVIPEPSSISLLALASVCLLRRRNIRRQA